MIVSMTPSNQNGRTRRVTTTKSDARSLKTRYYKLSSEGRSFYFPVTQGDKTVVTKPLFDLVDSDGNTYTLTKRQANRMFGGRQVRKALRRCGQEERNLIMMEIAEDRRRRSDVPEPEVIAMDTEQPITLIDETSSDVEEELDT